TINSKHRLVTGISRYFLDVLLVIPKGHSKAVHLDAKSLFEQLLRPDHFVLHPLLVLGAGYFRSSPLSAGNECYGMSLAQVLMRRGMGLDVHAVIAHVCELFPCDCFAAA